MFDRCVCCGAYIPEGFGMVCQNCEKNVDEKSRITMSNGVTVCGNIVKFMDGTMLPPYPKKVKSTTIINRKVYINKHEFKNGKWRITLKSLFY